MSVPPQRVSAVRRFNRFYTRRIGVLQGGLLRSPYSLMNLEGVRYGETNTLLDGKEARGFGKVQALPSLLWRLAGKRAVAEPASPKAHAKAKAQKSGRKTSRR